MGFSHPKLSYIAMAGGYAFSDITFIYREFKSTFEIIENTGIRLTKFYLSLHSLAIETCSNRNTEHSARKCNFCTNDEIEDDYYFVLICPYCNELTIYIKRYFYTRPSMYRFINLLNTTKLKELNTCNFLFNAFKLSDNPVITS